MLKEFKEFIMRGNVIDLAVGVVMGGAFSAIVNALVDDIIMPLVGMALGRINFSEFFLALNGVQYASLTEATAAGAPVLAYGQFIQSVVNFLIIALCIFFLVKAINKLHNLGGATTDEAPQTKNCPYCYKEVDLHASRCPYCTSELPRETTAG